MSARSYEVLIGLTVAGLLAMTLGLIQKFMGHDLYLKEIIAHDYG